MSARPILFWLCFLAANVGHSQSYLYVILGKRTHATELPAEEVKKLMQGHMANMDRLANENKLLVAGPFEGGGGIFILNTRSTEEAKEWMSKDPAIAANRWNVEILPFDLHGTICPVDTSAKMVTYTWIRFRGTGKHSPEAIEGHRRYLATLASSGIVISEGTFPQPGEGILVLKGEPDEKLINSDPAVMASCLEYEKKKWWVAEGCFCETDAKRD